MPQAGLGILLAMGHEPGFDDLSMPFRCVGSALRTSAAVVLDPGNVAPAMLAGGAAEEGSHRVYLSIGSAF